MVLCRFFQQGNCRYGNSCRFEHQGNPRQFYPSNQYGGDNNQSNYNVSTNNRFGSFGNNDNRGGGGRQFSQAGGGSGGGAGGGGTTFNDFVNSVILELDLSIKGKQWPFSCFGPQKDGDNWPGLEDMSPEELRFEAYQCQQQGRMNTYVQGVEQLKAANLAKNNEIKSRSPVVMDLMRKCFQGQKTETSFSAFGQQQASGGPGSNSVGTTTVPFTFSLPQFGSGSSQQGTVLPFGQSNPPPPPSYGQATASWSTSQPFTPSNPLVQPASGFGSNTNSHFGQVSELRVFGTPPPSQQQQQSAFGTQQQQSAFGTPPQQQQQSVFGTPQQQPSAFGTPPPQQQSAFGTPPPQQSIFGTKPQPFGVSNTNTPFLVQNIPQQTSNVINTTTNDPNLKGIHTAMDELTEAEKEQFMATTFAIGKIPVRPPPKELC